MLGVGGDIYLRHTAHAPQSPQLLGLVQSKAARDRKRPLCGVVEGSVPAEQPSLPSSTGTLQPPQASGVGLGPRRLPPQLSCCQLSSHWLNLGFSPLCQLAASRLSRHAGSPRRALALEHRPSGLLVPALLCGLGQVADCLILSVSTCKVGWQ